MQEKVLILDFGSQYTQLIARRVRELNIYCEIFPFNNNKYKISDYKALILSGSPYSVRSEDSLKINIDKIRGVLPVLGICYGAQLLAHNSGGVVKASKTREYGRANLQSIDNTNNLFSNIQNSSQVWMSHADTIFKLPPSTKRIASTKDVENAAFQFIDENTFGIQFHPEVYHSSDGKTLLKNFLVDIANINPNWTASSFVDKTIHELKNIIGDESVVLGLSGGVDSSVAAVLLNKAIGNNLYCVFIDNGLLRKNEFDSVLKQYEGMGLNVKGVDAKDKFYSALKNIDDPEKKRKVIGKVFVDVFGLKSAKEIYKLKVDGFKIHSTDITNPNLLNFFAKKTIPLLLSTAGCTRNEISEALKILNPSNREIVLMHGFQGFPTKVEDLHLRRINSLKKYFDLPVGLMDHISGDSPLSLIIPLLGIASGVEIIEKHITLNRDDKGIDYFSALNPNEFKKMISLIRLSEKSFGSPEFDLGKNELEYRHLQKKNAISKQIKSENFGN